MRVKTWVAAAALLAACAEGAAAQQRVNESRATAPTGIVEVHDVAGRVRVVGWGENRVQVTGTLGSEDERLELNDEAGITIVRVVLPRGEHDSRGADLEIRVPAGKDVEVQTVSADAVVEGIDGRTEVQSVSGGVRVSGGRARQVAATSRSGEVEVTADAERVEATSISGSVQVGGTVRDRVEATSVSGEVTVNAAAGEVEASSVSGSVTVASMRGRAEVHSVSGDLRVTGRGVSGSFNTVSGEIVLSGDLARGGDLELTSHSGTITLQLASGASAEVQVGTFSGDIEADYPGARVTRESRREARIVVGSGDAHVAVHTFSGDVKLIAR